MFTSIAVAPVNHVLHGESWARKSLQAFAGKTVCIRNFIFPDIILTIQDNGKVLAALNDNSPDTILTLTPDLYPRLLVHDETAFDNIKISGDDAFASVLLEVAKNIHWDVEQDLSKIMGDIPAHRVVQLGDNIMHWHRASIHKLAQALVEYLTEERSLLVNTVYISEFFCEVDTLHNDAERLEERLQKLINKMS